MSEDGDKLVLPPSLDSDSRITNKNECYFSASDVIYTFVTGSLWESVSDEAVGAFSPPPHPQVDHTNRVFGVLLYDYGEKLRADKRYPLTSKKFLDALSSPVATVLATIKKLMKDCFYPTGLKNCSDDRIMMILAVTVDMISKALLEPDHKLAVLLYINFGLKTFQEPGFTLKNLADKMKTWVDTYDSIVDPNRMCDLLSPLIKIATTTKVIAQPVRSPYKAPLPSTTKTPKSAKPKPWYANDKRVTTPDDVKAFNIEHVFDSFIMARVRENLYLSNMAAKLMRPPRNYTSQKIGVAMKDYGDVIHKQSNYTRFLMKVLTIMEDSQNPMNDFTQIIEECVIPLKKNVVFDRIIVMLLLTADLIKMALYNKRFMLAQNYRSYPMVVLGKNVIFQKVIRNGLINLRESRDHWINRKQFDIFENNSCIGLPAESFWTVAPPAAPLYPVMYRTKFTVMKAPTTSPTPNAVKVVCQKYTSGVPDPEKE